MHTFRVHQLLLRSVHFSSVRFSSIGVAYSSFAFGARAVIALHRFSARSVRRIRNVVLWGDGAGSNIALRYCVRTSTVSCSH